MSGTLTNFLIGIGWDTSSFDQGTKHIESSMGSVKSSVLQTAASIASVAAMTGAGLKFAKSTSEIDNFTRSIGVGRSDLLAFGGALQGMGGDADSAMGILTSLEQKRASILTGDTGWIPTAARAGINTDDILQASDSLDAVLRLSDQFKNAAPQQRLNMADALGFDPATMAFLSQGRDVVEATLNQYRDARPPVDGLIEASRDLTQEWSQLESLAGGIGDKVQSKLIPAITEATGIVNEFLRANKEAIDAGIEKYGTPENIQSASVAAAGAGVTTGGAVAGSLLQRFGLTGTGSLVAGGARLAGGAGIAYGVSDIASRFADEQLQQIPGYQELDAAFTRKAYDVTGWDLSRGNVYEGTPRESLFPDMSTWMSGGFGVQATPPRPAIPESVKPVATEIEYKHPIIVEFTRETESVKPTEGWGGLYTPARPAIPESVKPVATEIEYKHPIVVEFTRETDNRPPTPVELIDNRNFKPVIELTSWGGINGSPEPAKNPQPEMLFDWGNIVKEWDFDSLRDDIYSGATINPTAPEVIPPVDDRRNRDAVPTRQPTTINVNATLEMDGKVLAEKVLSVVSDSNQAALDDLQSTTER